MDQAKSAPLIFKEVHRTLIRWMDMCFGAVSAALLIVVGVAAYAKLTSWKGFALQLTIPLFNVVMSQAAVRSRTPRTWELTRCTTNCVLAALSFIWIDGALDQFWLNYIIINMGSPILVTLMVNARAGLLTVFVDLLSMAVATQLTDRPVNWFMFATFSSISLVSGIFVLRTVVLVLKMAEQQEEKNRELERSQRIIIDQQQAMVSASKMSALGEMSGGLAHEINNPLTVIKVLSHQLQRVLEVEPIDTSLAMDMSSRVETTTNRIARIVAGLRTFSRDGSNDPFCAVNVQDLIDETLSFCGERLKHNGAQLRVEEFDPQLAFEGRQTEISQVLLNLLNNANDAIAELPEGMERWVEISVLDRGDRVEIHITDSGGGIQPHIREKIFQPFFTTKGLGNGTGMGLSISSGIVRNHHGDLSLDEGWPHTRFAIRLPKKQVSSAPRP